MSVGDVYELRLTATHTTGETSVNVWHYEVDENPTGPSGADDLINSYASFVASTLTAQTSVQWTYTNLFAFNLDEDEDWSDSPISFQGAAPGNGLPAQLAVAFRSPKQNTGVNRSAKRLPLGNVSSIDGNGRLGLPFRDNCFFIQQSLGLPVASPTNVYIPVTVQKQYVDRVFVGYVIRAVVVGQWEINRAFSTQKSRQEYMWEVAEEPA